MSFTGFRTTELLAAGSDRVQQTIYSRRYRHPHSNHKTETRATAPVGVAHANEVDFTSLARPITTTAQALGSFLGYERTNERTKSINSTNTS